MSFRSPIGISDFRMLRERGATYVDKSAFAAEVLADPAAALLLPRPRRFGKTLNLSMLRCFVEKSDWDASPLFSDLAVWRDAAAREHFQRYPVIFLTFKDVKHRSWSECLTHLGILISDEYQRHDLRSHSLLNEEQQHRVGRIRRGEAGPVELVFHFVPQCRTA